MTIIDLRRRSSAVTPLFPRIDSNNVQDLKEGLLPLTPIIFGAATFGNAYNSAAFLKTDVPEQALLLALRLGINAIDTSTFYTSSQEILGSILSKPEVRKEFPRSSYHLLTKCGRYGHKREDFDYSRERTLESVRISLSKLKTDYLDACYLHDVEFVATDVGSSHAAGAVSPRDFSSSTYGLAPGQESIIWGHGDVQVLQALSALFELKDAGVVRRVGISGYPLPTLLRLARLVPFRLGRPLDLLMSYSHATLQCASFPDTIPLFHSAGVGQLVNASPLSMGLLRSAGPQAWHPAPEGLRQACREASDAMRKRGTSLERVALAFGLSRTGGGVVPTAVGFSTPDEVRDCAEVYAALSRPVQALEEEDKEVLEEVEGVAGSAERQLEDQKIVIDILKRSGFYGWSWASPPPKKPLI